MRKIMTKVTGMAALASIPVPAFAQEAVEAAPAVANPGNNAWMMTATILVLLMILPGLALFYGGLTRTKNMLSTMTQIGAAACLAMLIWVMYGYGLAFGPEGNAFISWGKFFLAGVDSSSTAATFSDEVISEYVFISFQMTFAAITLALVLGSVVERMKFSAVMVFGAIWLTIVYFPIAHMVWAGGGLLFEMGALDFAGGTVVHINAGVSALVAALILGKRTGYPKEPMPPHSLTLTMIGTGMLWVGWFGFNAGSELEADGTAGLAMINTFVATASAALFWMLAEKLSGRKGSALGFCSGVIAGLVAVTPAAGNSGPFGAIVLGAVASLVCYYAVSFLKPKLGYDDSLDAFGIHGIGGMVGAIGTGIVYQPMFGGPGDGSTAMGAQVITQIIGVLVTIGWAGIGTAIAMFIAKLVTGLRVSEEVEQEGLDLGEHGERAYNY
ncbi:MAG: ammonium transporter [Sphingomonadales bacterium]|nr:ammonium transporter [Sphingomonadales bacterium]NCP00587.1 ammonium transporter [Sphingomonadales bacterium]NCP25539.1 ammonium transporter [Sphingomonadales bacterium]NCP44749.1 ammonium transporter [Sphingomonadales bacterium]NCQ10257.1 ammonium transporter [Sphingomonadales bacterium]